MTGKLPPQKKYTPRDSVIPPGYYRLDPRISKEGATTKLARKNVEVDERRRFRAWDGAGNWESLDSPAYSGSIFKGPYKDPKALLADI